MNATGDKSAIDAEIRKAEIRADLLKWLIGTVALTLVTTVGNWTFQYYSLRAEAEKTNRELKIKEKEMQLSYLEKFTTTAIDQDITKRIRLAHYISSTIDDKEYGPLAKRWADYYSTLLRACQDRLKLAVTAGKIEIQQELSNEPACTIGGLETIKAVAPPLLVPAPSAPDGLVGGGKLGELIARAESGERGYNSFNRGIAGDSAGKTIDFSVMTIDDLLKQQALPRGNPARLFAVGRYSLIPMTMRGAISALKLEPTAKFTPSVQERIFRGYIIGSKNPAVKNYITGASDDLNAAQIALAFAFATVARPDTGLSAYGGSGGATALVTAQQTAQALIDERAAYQQLVDAGKSPEDAWQALSPGITEAPIQAAAP
jgi:hypothetical protein